MVDLAWLLNMIFLSQRSMPWKHFVLTLSNDMHSVKQNNCTIWRVDCDHGNVIKSFDKMGRPALPSRAQISELRAPAHMTAPELRMLVNGKLAVDIPIMGIAVVEIR